jgi:AraC-like DNA-binding protein
MAGPAHSYRVDPNGEVVLGLVTSGAMSVRRGRRRFVFSSGEACIWDATDAHAGVPQGCVAWGARVIVIEAPAVEDHLRDLDLVSTGFTFPEPHLADPMLVDQLAALHRCSADPGTPRLAMQSLLNEHLTAVLCAVGAAPAAGQTMSRARARRDPALRRGCDYLLAHLADNISLDEIAAAAGAPRFRVLRLFRAAFGAPPHRFQLAHRIVLARRLLESGRTASNVALATGFVDQAHLHRCFVRTLGITPGRYARAFRRGLQERTRPS